MNNISFLITNNNYVLDIRYGDYQINLKNKLYLEEEKKFTSIKNLKNIKNYKNVFSEIYNLINPYYYITKDSILLYEYLIFNNKYYSWNYYKNNLDFNKNYNSLFINTLYNLGNVEDYMIIREKNSIYSYSDSSELIILNTNNKQNPEYVNKFIKVYNQINVYNLPNLDKFKVLRNKYDFIDINTIDNNEDDFKINLIIINKVFNHLETKGNIRISIKNINSKISIDFIYLLNYYFENIYIDKSILQNQFDSTFYINCFKFKGGKLNLIEQIVSNLKKNKSNYIAKIFKANNYKQFSKIIEDESKNKIFLLDQILDCYNNLKNNSKNELNYREIQLKEAILFSTENNLPIKFKYEKQKENYYSFDNSELNFCQILFMLNNLPKNKNFIIKVFLPQSTKYIISLNYILYNTFNELICYKPTLNPSSSEIYIIAKGYKKLSKEELEKLFKLKEELDIYKGIIPKIDNTFMQEYEKCMVNFIQQNINSIKRSLFYYENYDNFYNLKNTINKKKDIYIKNWLSQFKIKEINKGQILNIT
jgi:hypothetical protein